LAAADHYAERPMANLSVRIPDELLANFDGWAGAHGGRAPALRRLMIEAAGTAPTSRRLAARPLKLTVRLSADDGAGLDHQAAAAGLTPNAWVGAVVRHRLANRPTFPRDQALAILAMQAELRRIGVNVNQIARALNTAVMEGKILDLEVAYLEDLRTELRAHMSALGEAFAGNLAYWQGDP
jgi:hypothetical protein